MNLPLEPFLASLVTDGIRITVRDYERIGLALQTGEIWTVPRLRDTLLALLTKNAEQQDLFLRRFNSVFLTGTAAVGKIDLAQALADLQYLANQEPKPPPKPSLREHLQKLFQQAIKNLKGKSSVRFEEEQEFDGESRDRSEIDKSLEEEPEHLTTGPAIEDQPARWNPDGPRYFPLSSIGGKPAARVNNATLSHLADSMSYFQSQQAGKRLHVQASIQATLPNGGIPELVFQKRKQIRSLLILEDAFAEPLLWNPLAGELAEGIQRYGIPTLYGRFFGSPEQFKTEDGSLYRLEDLEDQRRGYILLIFTDGKSFSRHQNLFLLERLRRWPMVAWMELREPRFWGVSATLPARYDIPVYPANPEGTIQAIRRFLTEQGTSRDFSTHEAQRIPELAQSSLEGYIEQMLGDALLWAQDCAMFPLPISQGLADALRRQFHVHLPPERIERLFRLPDTIYNVSGLRFSPEVMRILRTGFLMRRSPEEQEVVLEFIIKEIEKTAPPEPESLAALTREAIKERIRMELDPEDDLQRLSQIAGTPLGEFISDSFESFGFPGETEKIPLRLKPLTKKVLQRLCRITEHLGTEESIDSTEEWIEPITSEELIDSTEEWIEPITSMEFVWISGGTFLMGSPNDEDGRFEDEEGPAHEVSLDGFWMAITPITNAQYRKWRADHNSGQYGGHTLNEDDQPVVNVSWREAKAFAQWLTKQHEGRYEFRLPTEAEWEYACRAGTSTVRFWGDRPDKAYQYANVADQTFRKTFKDFAENWSIHNCDDGFAVTSPVKSFQPNDFALYDMLGNVWEWCEDIYSSDAYRKHELYNPVNIGNGTDRVLRGGCWDDIPRGVRCAVRDNDVPDCRDNDIGFRLLRIK